MTILELTRDFTERLFATLREANGSQQVIFEGNTFELASQKTATTYALSGSNLSFVVVLGLTQRSSFLCFKNAYIVEKGDSYDYHHYKAVLKKLSIPLEVKEELVLAWVLDSWTDKLDGLYFNRLEVAQGEITITRLRSEAAVYFYFNGDCIYSLDIKNLVGYKHAVVSDNYSSFINKMFHILCVNL